MYCLSIMVLAPKGYSEGNLSVPPPRQYTMAVHGHGVLAEEEIKYGTGRAVRPIGIK